MSRLQRGVVGRNNSTFSSASLALWLVCLLLPIPCLHAASTPATATGEEAVYAADLLRPSGSIDQQGECLLALKEAVSGAGDGTLTGSGVITLWPVTTHPCGDDANNTRPWLGVACDAPQGSVLRLDLSGQGLVGTLPPELGGLDMLQQLLLGNNSLHGPLPDAWQHLQQLEELQLQGNSLTFTLPSAWGIMASLEVLQLQGNALTGPLPSSWGGMHALQALHLDRNALASTLPEAWGRLGMLSTLTARSAGLAGTLPPAWKDLHALLQLDLAGNQLKGPLPSDWAVGMDSLRSIDLSSNALTGQLPPAWVNLTRLQSLSLAGNQLSGPLPAHWLPMANLYSLHVGNNSGLCGDVPAGLGARLGGGNATQLNSSCYWEPDAALLLLFKHSVSADPSALLSSWKTGSNPCGGAPWQGITCSGGWVAGLQLAGAQLRGTLSPALGWMSQLREIHLQGNAFSGSLPREWGRLQSLQTLELANNALDGPLPQEWSRMKALSHLDLSNNRLDSHLPGSWGEMSTLAVLLLQNNRFTDSIPEAWAGATALQVVKLAGNDLSGSLPKAWPSGGIRDSLRELDVAQNKIAGPIPHGWDGMRSMRYLDVQGNVQMCGNMPDMPQAPHVQQQGTGLQVACPLPAGRVPAAGIAMIAGLAAAACAMAVLAGVAGLSAVRAKRALQAVQGVADAARDLAGHMNGPARPPGSPYPNSPGRGGCTPLTFAQATPPPSPHDTQQPPALERGGGALSPHSPASSKANSLPGSPHSRAASPLRPASSILGTQLLPGSPRSPLSGAGPAARPTSPPLTLKQRMSSLRLEAASWASTGLSSPTSPRSGALLSPAAAACLAAAAAAGEDAQHACARIEEGEEGSGGSGDEGSNQA